MKKFIILILLGVLIFYNYEKLDELFFQMNLSQNQLEYDKAYLFDLNGDGENEEIKLKSYKDINGYLTVDLYINNKLKEQYKDKENISVHIYDFNKMDGSKEICVVLGNNIECNKSNIFIYKNEDEKYNYMMNGRIVNNDDKNGSIKIAYASSNNSSDFKNYSKIIGGEDITVSYLYKRVLYFELQDVDKKEVNVVGVNKEYEYIAMNKISVYETNVGNVKAYTLSTGDKINLISLYNYQDNQCIKVVNKEGRYGWIKVEDKQTLKKSE